MVILQYATPTFLDMFERAYKFLLHQGEILIPSKNRLRGHPKSPLPLTCIPPEVLRQYVSKRTKKHFCSLFGNYLLIVSITYPPNMHIMSQAICPCSYPSECIPSSTPSQCLCPAYQTQQLLGTPQHCWTLNCHYLPCPRHPAQDSLPRQDTQAHPLPVDPRASMLHVCQSYD